MRTFLDEGTLTIDDVVNTMNKKKEAYVKKNHRYKISQDSQGRWRTYYRDPDLPKSQRTPIVNKDRDVVIYTLYDLYTKRAERVKKRLITIEGLHDDWIEYKRLHGIS